MLEQFPPPFTCWSLPLKYDQQYTSAKTVRWDTSTLSLWRHRPLQRLFSTCATTGEAIRNISCADLLTHRVSHRVPNLSHLCTVHPWCCILGQTTLKCEQFLCKVYRTDVGFGAFFPTRSSLQACLIANFRMDIKGSIGNSRRNYGLLAVKIVDTEFPVKPRLNGLKASHAPDEGRNCVSLAKTRPVFNRFRVRIENKNEEAQRLQYTCFVVLSFSSLLQCQFATLFITRMEALFKSFSENHSLNSEKILTDSACWGLEREIGTDR